MRRSLFLMVGGALLAVLLAVNFLCNDTPDRARIVRISGPVVLERAQQRIIPVVGMMLNAQDKLITGDGAFIEVAYDDLLKGAMRIGANARVVFESARIERQTNLFMDRGGIMIKLDNLEKGSTFKVRTPVAIAGVRGTAFGIRLDGDQAFITDYESRIFVKGITRNHLEMKDELLLNDGWKAQVTKFEKPSQVERLTPEESAGWQAWLSELKSLQGTVPVSDAGASGLAQTVRTALHEALAFVTAVRMKVSLSPSVLSMMLYAVLALGMGKVVERVWL